MPVSVPEVPLHCLPWVSSCWVCFPALSVLHSCPAFHRPPVIPTYWIWVPTSMSVLINWCSLPSWARLRAPKAGLQGEPSVALLNVGHEDSKGDAVVKEAHGMLKELPINYTGFIEGSDIFAGKADVAVCDGFSGNLILKSGEGLASMFFEHIKLATQNGWLAKLGALLLGKSLQDTLERFEPSKHNGAPLLGLRGVVVKSHGNADRKALGYAINEAIVEAQRQVPRLIESMINDFSIEAGL